ncbi:MAG: asparagine synthase-related protein [Acidobacteriota bacterium]
MPDAIADHPHDRAATEAPNPTPEGPGFRYVHRILDLVDDDSQQLMGSTVEQARELLTSGDPEAFGRLRGSFALTARSEDRVYLARSLDRPLRYFLAKEESGPLLVVAERIDRIAEQLEELGYGHQFHPSYTRMVPAHHVLSLRLIGCPDPNPEYLRFFSPPRATATTDVEAAGERYVGALLEETRRWLAARPADEPLGVLFSGGLDSGTVLLCAHQALLDLGQSPARLKAFTLAVDGGGEDLEQAQQFLRRTELEMLGELVEVRAEAVNPLAAVEVIEDYRPLDVECAAVLLALLGGIRERYPEWRLLLDGDGGDENLKDYPIEDNPELTIRSVVNNSMLYQEGWGVNAIKHSLTYSGGHSRGCVRTYAPLVHYGFEGFSPNLCPAVIAESEALPFDALTAGSHDRLYALKGEVLAAGVRRVLGQELPVFPKRRFQHGATPSGTFGERPGMSESLQYRQHFQSLWS